MAKLRDVHQAMLEAQLAKLEGMRVAQAIAVLYVVRATTNALLLRARCSAYSLLYNSFCWDAQQNVTLTTIVLPKSLNRRCRLDV